MTTAPEQVAAGDADTAPETPTPGGARRALPWVVVAIAVAVAAVATINWQRLQRQEDARDEVTRATGRAITVLTNWDADELRRVRREVASFGTTRFQQEARGYFEQFTRDLTQADATSQGEVLDLAVTLTTRDTAVALGVVRQQITLGGEAAVDVACWGARAHLVHQDGSWLLDGLELYGSNACPEDVAEPQGPGDRG